MLKLIQVNITDMLCNPVMKDPKPNMTHLLLGPFATQNNLGNLKYCDAFCSKHQASVLCEQICQRVLSIEMQIISESIYNSKTVITSYCHSALHVVHQDVV